VRPPASGRSYIILRGTPFEHPNIFAILPGLKLDRLIAKHRSTGRTAAHRLIAACRVKVDGATVLDGQREVDRFSRIELNDEILQHADRALYLMIHKPVGILSATVDPQHPTVIDLIDDPHKHMLHLAGRLDRGTSGLVLLTNDGRWSKRVTDPRHKMPKVYLVETGEPISPDAVTSFAAGFHFHTENITTLPAVLEITGIHNARLSLIEGRYHQVKRMFHRVGNRVVKLHRESIGSIALPPDLAAGQWRHLTPDEVASVYGDGTTDGVV
jgi:16S rRNA pseudouridine516 synthase